MKVLVINAGSSTVKARFIDTATHKVLGKGIADRIGFPESELNWVDANGSLNRTVEKLDVEQAVGFLVEQSQSLGTIEAVGHRVVAGGERFTRPTLLDDETVQQIDDLSFLAPLHNPGHAAGMRASRHILPDVPQVAVFDTAFHATMPPHAYRYAVPEDLYRELAVRRYGAHGTSHQYLSRVAGEYLARHGVPAPHRVITLHLGNGASVAAVKGGVCVDTSMGMTPLEGLMMGTRTGDIDPAVIPYIQQKRGWGPAETDRFLNKQCGLLGVSGRSADMRDVERARGEGDRNAALAFDMFCYRIRKYVGAYTSVLDGLDALVFSGGIGENSPAVRETVLSGLGWVGLRQASPVQEDGVTVITEKGAWPVALVIPTDEEGLIAAQTAELVCA